MTETPHKHDLYGMHQYHPYIKTGNSPNGIEEFNISWEAGVRPEFEEYVQERMAAHEPNGVAIFAFRYETTLKASTWTVLRGLYNCLIDFRSNHSSGLHTNSIRSLGRVIEEIEEHYDAVYDDAELPYAGYPDEAGGQLMPAPEITLEPLTWDDPNLQWARERRRDSAKKSRPATLIEVSR